MSYSQPFKRFSSQVETAQIDEANGIIRGIKIAQFGANKNGYFFTEKFLTDLVEQGNSKDGVKCRFNHPDLTGSSLGTYIGRKKNFHFKGNDVHADLHVDPIAREQKIDGVSRWKWVFHMAENNPDMFGASIDIRADVYEEKFDNQTLLVPILKSFVASDFVDEQAATDHLFQEENTHKNMSKLDNLFTEIKKLFSADNEQFDITDTNEAGVQVVVKTENDFISVGDPVELEEGGAAPDGEHYIVGVEKTIVVKDGVIESIKEDETTEETEEFTEETLPEQFKALQLENLQFKEKIESKDAVIEKSFELFKSYFQEAKEQSKIQTEEVSKYKEAFEKMELKFNELKGLIVSPKAETFDAKDTLRENDKKETARERMNRERKEREETQN